MKDLIKIAVLIFVFVVTSANASPLKEQKITFEKGEKKFKINKEDGFCEVCESEIYYPKFEGNPAGIKKINENVKKFAEGFKCTKENSISDLNYKITHNDGAYLSILFDVGTLMCGGGGSCHGHSMARIYNVSTGDVISFSDVIMGENQEKIKSVMLNNFTDLNGEQKKLFKEHLDKNLKTLAFFIENKQFYINADYFFNCADGSFQPVKIGKEFIKNDAIKDILEK